MFIHVNGELCPESEATVSVRDRGFRYGDGVFETLRAYGGSIFEYEAHRDRLHRSASDLGMAEAIPADLAERIDDTLVKNEREDAYVRVSITRGVQPGKLTPRPATDPTIVVECAPLNRGGVAGSPVWEGPAVVQSVQTRRVPDSAQPVGAKTHNYLDGILARLEVAQAATEDYQADEALLRATDGTVAEGATSNCFFVDDGTLKTPAEGTILPGITRAVVLELARTEAFPVETGRYTLEDVRSADEAFLTNTTWELRPIESLDGIAIGGGPITALLTRLFDERVERLYDD